MIKTILTVLIILLILRFVARLFQVSTTTGSGGQQRNSNTANPNVRVDRADTSGKHHNNDDAEYIDYEEVN